MYSFNQIPDEISKSFEKGVLNTSTIFSQMIDEKVELSFSELDEKQLGNKLILRTNIIGELEGVSFLVLNWEDAREIGELGIDPDVKQEFGDLDDSFILEYLLEMDNVLSSSLLTSLVKSFGIEVYGNVPSRETIDSLTKELTSDRYYYSVGIRLEDIDKVVELELFWFFSKSGVLRLMEEQGIQKVA